MNITDPTLILIGITVFLFFIICIFISHNLSKKNHPIDIEDDYFDNNLTKTLIERRVSKALNKSKDKLNSKENS